MTDIARTQRIAEQLRQELSILLRREFSSPDINMVSITLVKVVRDLSQATVYVTYLGDKEKRPMIMQRLVEIAPMLRKMLGKILRLRTIPKFIFVYDEVFEKGLELSNLIASAIATDEKKAEDHPENVGEKL